MRRISVLINVILVFILGIPSSCSRQAARFENVQFSTEELSASDTFEIPEKWWLVFNDRELESVIDTALNSNFDLKVAWQRLEASRAVARGEASFLYPGIDAFFTAESGNGRAPGLSGSDISNRLSAGLNSEYEIDLFGRIRANRQAERYRSDAVAFDHQSAAITLSAEIATSWFGLTEAGNQIELINNQILTIEQSLDLMLARFGSGQVRGVDILRQRQLLVSTREQRNVVEERISLLENQLAVLLGRRAGTAEGLGSDSLPKLPLLPDSGIPARLIARRPDVQSSYNLLLAADRDLAAAISSRYPRLSISASALSQSEDYTDLFNEWIYNIAANLAAPVFSGGRLKAEADRTRAVRTQRLYEYSQTVLTAFREVHDAVARENKQRESIRSLDEQLSLASKAYEQLRIEYFNGVGNYLDVLTALTQEQQLQRSLLSAKLILLENRINLYQALAGGVGIEGEMVQ
jgi:outer membrane protein, multidrug efflux system